MQIKPRPKNIMLSIDLSLMIYSEYVGLLLYIPIRDLGFHQEVQNH